MCVILSDNMCLILMGVMRGLAVNALCQIKGVKSFQDKGKNMSEEITE